MWHVDMGGEQVRASRQGYYSSSSFLDEQIGTLLETLDKRGWLGNTLIIFTADHGDMTGDHHMWRKSYAYEASARIPMLMRWPKGFADDQRGQTRWEPVELRDVFPTCLDAAGGSVDVPLDGRSMLDIVRGKADDWRTFIDLEHDVCYSKKNHWTAVTDGHTKYIYHAFDGEEQLFDLDSDPGEERDLAGDTAHTETLQRWRGRMVAHLEERGPEWVKNGRLVPRPERMLYSPNYPKSAEGKA